MSFRSWSAVGAVALGTFSIVTTEMLPVGLLTPMGAEMGVSGGIAGLTMSLPGLVAAVAAPAVTLCTGRLDRRLVLCALMALLAAANLLSAAAPGFEVLLASRILVGLSIGGFWAIAAGLAVRLVPERSVGAATSTIFSGVAVASVLGVPAGAFAGELAGWRSAFAAMGVLALAVLTGLALLLPPLPPNAPFRVGEVPRLLRDRRARTGLVVTLLLVTGHFAAYTYVRPALEQISGIGAGLIGGLLLVYGAAGVIGNFAAGVAAARRPRRTLFLIAALLGMVVLLVPVAGTVPPGAIVLLVVWGLAYGGVSVTTQTWLLKSGAASPEAASAVFVSAFNVAIALGALTGGRIADIALPGVMWFGGALALLAAATVRPAIRPSVRVTGRCRPPQ
ncbi:MFS transporter [Actinomadura rudentiformis]|uniref:MFS transporter n=1 Tax=Actinomadura rudentiformis TaxID=359158 RepID=A0A6H9Z3S4_9ACTN|nr:MFS transporter [Actinomadura rudentiformis]KAB2349461.1 MFS transporter [Actinomadura rudentiformis]